VFDTIVATAARLCGSDRASITIREGEVYRYVSTTEPDHDFWAILRQRRIVPGRQSVAGRVALEGRASRAVRSARAEGPLWGIFAHTPRR
jgi:hypothetical protein